MHLFLLCRYNPVGRETVGNNTNPNSYCKTPKMSRERGSTVFRWCWLFCCYLLQWRPTTQSSDDVFCSSSSSSSSFLRKESLRNIGHSLGPDSCSNAGERPWEESLKMWAARPGTLMLVYRYQGEGRKSSNFEHTLTKTMLTMLCRWLLSCRVMEWNQQTI